MDAQNDLLSTDIEAYLRQHEQKSLLRFITCGSVDDGKSTLIGRLLYDSRMIFEDQLAALEADSKKMGTQGQNIDFALLVDGLAAEREQGITIDVAYRFFATEKRKFIVADTPGHEQYTRNMVTGASTADVAVILIDARRGVLTQTRRHSYLASLVGIRNVVLAINKMDLVNYSQDVFNRILGDYMNFASGLSLETIVAIPMSALAGDNITEKSGNTPWYMGQPLLAHLETVPTRTADRTAPFRMPVQWVNRPNQDFRGFSGLIAAGAVQLGDTVRVMPSGRESRVSRLFLDGDMPFAVAGQSVTISLEDEIDCSRGDVLTGVDDPIEVSDQFEVTIVWMNETPMLPGRSYLLKLGAKTVVTSVTALKHKINVNTLEQVASKSLAMNEIGLCNISLSQPVAFDPYEKNRETGGFILIDRFTNETVAAGTIHFALRRAQNIHWQAMEIDRAARAVQKNQKAFVLWFTGLSGAGKSTIANIVERRLFERGKHSTMLDGDNVRHRLNRDLGFTDGDRVENIRRVGEVARLMTDAGLIVLVSFISPFRSERQMARELLPEGEFLEVFIDTPLAIAEERDPKGLYKKARRGEIKNFTGISSPYEAPEDPEIRLDTTALTPEQAAGQIIEALEQRGLLRGYRGMSAAETLSLSALLAAIRPVAEEAGRATLAFYGDKAGTREKADGSPVTLADEAAEAVILPALRALTPEIPVVSEEEAAQGIGPTSVGARFWLVDPLDGTKEFISGNGEFTVNIALIEDGRPVLGIVVAPALGETYAGADGEATLVDASGERKILCRIPPEEGETVVGSRSHGDASAMDAFLKDRRVAAFRAAGSSLKLCLIARGEADLYPRLGTTMEWDIAAGHAVLAAAGGGVATLDGEAFLYGKPDFRNPHFVAYGAAGV